MTRGLVLIMILLLAGCAESYTVFHSQTGNPIILGRRAYYLRRLPLHDARGGGSTWGLPEYGSSERFLARSIPPLALRARVCLRRDNRPRTSPKWNLSERSTPLTSRIVITHLLPFFPLSACRIIRDRFFLIPLKTICSYTVDYPTADEA